MSQAKGLVPLCERRTCTSRPCGVEKTWRGESVQGQASQGEGAGKESNRSARKRSLPCCTWHTCKSQCWWAMGGTRGPTPLWCCQAPSPAAAQAASRHRVQALLLEAARTTLGPGSQSHRKVRGKSYTPHQRGQARSRAHRRAPGLRFAPASGRACSFVPGASAQSPPGCSTHTVWRALRRGVLHPGMDTQIALRLWKHNGMGISAFHSPASVVEQNRLSIQACGRARPLYCTLELAFHPPWEGILYCFQC